MTVPRTLVWFSCGAASACAAKLSVEMYDNVEVLYCDTLKYEHPDNKRFLEKVETWIGQPIKILRSDKYTDIYDVFDKTGWLVGVAGARCTTELKRNVREKYQRANDFHVFGFGIDEVKRIEKFKQNNPELKLKFPLYERGMNKQDCLNMLLVAGIDLPALYKLGYKNNNCIGCVKGGKGYWNKIRKDFPDSFNKMAQQERKMGVKILKTVYLDELDPNAGRYESEFEIECGPVCNIVQDKQEKVRMTDEIILFGDGLDQAIQSDDDWVLNTIRNAVEKAKQEKDVSIAMTSCQQLVKIAKTSGRGLAEGLYLIWKNWGEFGIVDDDPIEYIYEHVGLHRATVERYIRVAKMLNNPTEFGIPSKLVEEIGQRNIKELIPIATALAQDYLITKKNWQKLANAADFTEVSKIIREDVKQTGARRNIVSITIDANGNLTAFNASGKRMPVGYLEVDLDDELVNRAVERIITNTGILRSQ